MDKLASEIGSQIEAAAVIVVLQADNPDSDSLGSALALEQILGDKGKTVHMYCGVEIPSYLKYMSGADRVSSELPKQFDLSVVVDASSQSLFERLLKSDQAGWLGTRPSIVLDHHAVTDKPLPFAKTVLNDPARSSTAELIYQLAKELKWPLNQTAQELLTLAILGDTQGLSNSLASPLTYRIMADMIQAGVDRPALEELRRSSSKMAIDIFRYKGQLIERTNFSVSGKVAYLSVPQAEINRYSPLYNPAPLIQGDMLQIEGVKLAAVFKHYDDGKLTAALRSNLDAPICADIAAHFGGGGHALASGFKIEQAKEAAAIIKECIELADKLMETK